MSPKILLSPGTFCLALIALMLLPSGCSSNFFANQTARRAGNISVQFVNNTPFRAAFTFGTYDSLDRNPPGPASLQQLRLESGASSAVAAVTCRRLFAIGTAGFVPRLH